MRHLLTAVIAALSSAHAKAALATGGVAASAATVTHSDPWPWVVSAAGALIVMVKLPATGRAQGAANGLISVMLGGLGSAFAVTQLGAYISPPPDRLLMAFALSAAWPLCVTVVQSLWPAIQERVQKKITGGQ
jgi:hypothetical protein